MAMQIPYYIVTFYRDRHFEERAVQERETAELLAHSLRSQYPEIGFIALHVINDEYEPAAFVSDDF